MSHLFMEERMTGLKLVFSADYFGIFMILGGFLVSNSHREDNIVNFNDALARIDRIDRTEENNETKVYYGDIPDLPISISEEEALNLKAIIPRPVNGWALLYNSTTSLLLSPDNELYSFQGSYNYGPMNNVGFWKFEDHRDTGEFLLLGFTDLIWDNWTIIDQTIVKDQMWRLVQQFEWGGDLFACFGRGDRKLIVLRLKEAPEEREKYGTFISSFYMESSANPMAYFLPSYPDPIMYYSRSEMNDTIYLNALNLNDALTTSDDGFRQCQMSGSYPKTFFRLQSYIQNLSKIYFNESDECENEIPIFQVTKSDPCFQIPVDVLKTNSVDTYTVDLDFNAKILAFINGSMDIRCDLNDCKKVMDSCRSEEIEFKSPQIVSTFWNFDNFTLTRWNGTSSMGDFRLLDCEYFQTCSLCTLYGGFKCVWIFSSCIKADNGSISVQDLCYPDVTAYMKLLLNGRRELIIKLPHKLNPKGGEKAYVKLDGKNYSDVKYTGGTYSLTIGSMDPQEAVIIIERGAYIMNTSFTVDTELSVLDILILFTILAIIVVFGLLYYFSRCRSNGTDEFQSTPKKLQSNATGLKRLPPVVNAGKFHQLPSSSPTPSIRASKSPSIPSPHPLSTSSSATQATSPPVSPTATPVTEAKVSQQSTSPPIAPAATPSNSPSN